MLGAGETQVGGLLSRGSGRNKSDRMGLPITSPRTTVSRVTAFLCSVIIKTVALKSLIWNFLLFQ